MFYRIYHLHPLQKDTPVYFHTSIYLFRCLYSRLAFSVTDLKRTFTFMMIHRERASWHLFFVLLFLTVGCDMTLRAGVRSKLNDFRGFTLSLSWCPETSCQLHCILYKFLWSMTLPLFVSNFHDFVLL